MKKMIAHEKLVPSASIMRLFPINKSGVKQSQLVIPNNFHSERELVFFPVSFLTSIPME